MLDCKKNGILENNQETYYAFQAWANVPVGGASHPTLLESPRKRLVSSAFLRHLVISLLRHRSQAFHHSWQR
jgi:hypothetical protein